MDRFLVLNELYHPAWRAWVDGREGTIYPTNVVMQGLVMPAGAAAVERFEAFGDQHGRAREGGAQRLGQRRQVVG